MYLKRVSICNVKGFECLDFDFERPDGSYAGWNVVTGINGSGKSTFLKCISMALIGRDTSRALQPTLRGWIRNPKKDSSIQLEVKSDPNDDSFVRSGDHPKSTFLVNVALKPLGNDVVLTTGSAGARRGKTPERGLWAPDAKGWFSCGYGPFRRIFGASAEAMRHMVAPSSERYVTMFQEAASLYEVDQWLRALSHKKLEKKKVESDQLSTVLEFISDDLMPSGVEVNRVDSDGLWLKDKNGISLSWDEMSDGYRAALALVVDIIRHLFNAYGSTDVFARTEDGRIHVKRSGIVLIDEVDAHLHPEWQRRIGFWMKEKFPLIQFIVTSHSPLICQSSDENGIFVLPGPAGPDHPRRVSVGEYWKIVASKPDEILLSSAFGLQNTRSDVAVEARSEYSKMMSKKRSGASLTDKEEERIKQLELFVR